MGLYPRDTLLGQLLFYIARFVVQLVKPVLYRGE